MASGPITVLIASNFPGGEGSRSFIGILAPVHPRLLDLHNAALYLGVSEWTVRDLEAADIIPRVRVPLPDHKELRKILFDVHDLDHLIDVWKGDNSSA